MSKRRSFRQNTGASLRPHAEAPRRKFMYIHVTEKERELIQEHCAARGISLSQFIADLILADAAKPKRKEKVTLKVEIELTPDELGNLELLTKFRQKDTIGELIYDLLQPTLALQRLHAPEERGPLRYYLSEEEYRIVDQYLSGKAMAARYYPVILALKAIGENRRKKK